MRNFIGCQPPALRSWAFALLVPTLLAGCGGGGSGSGTGSSFVDPTGDYDVSIEQTTDSCATPPNEGSLNWGGATLTLQGSRLDVDIPSEPGAMTCSQFTATYSMNAVQANGSQQVTDGTCTYRENLSVALMFTDSGFTGSYTTQRTRVSGDCSLLALPCTLAGTITGDKGTLGTPSCP